MKQFDIGIIGGGQLGKMLIEEGLRYNLRFATLDPEPHSPASFISHHHIVGSLYDADKIAELAACAKILTYEIEHINIDALLQLEKEGVLCLPQPAILAMIQDKGLQKDFYAQHNIPTSPYVLVENPSEWEAALKKIGSPKIAAKLRKGGYDGKGVALLDTESILNGTSPIPFDTPCVLEAFVACEKEISIMVCRDSKGNTTCFDPVEMDMDPVANLVTYLIAPAQVSESIKIQAQKIATDFVNHSQAIGIFAVEFFISKNGEVLVNEIAPRPHNSMHHSIEACYTSQYEQLIRILTQRPLGDTSLIQPAAMLNIIGGQGFSGAYQLAGESEVLQESGVYIHLYDKAESKPNRKLGHITVLDKDIEAVRKKADWVNKTVSIIPK